MNHKVNATTEEFLLEIRFRYRTLGHLYRQRYGADMQVSDNVRKQYGLVRELIGRRKQFGDAAEMTAMENTQVQGLANWLVNTWHDFHGNTENRPMMVFTDSGAGWVTSKDQL